MEEKTFIESYEAKEYIRSYNLDLRTIEQIVSFFMDKERCKENWWIKKEVVRAFHGENFSKIWEIAVKEIERESKRKARL